MAFYDVVAFGENMLRLNPPGMGRIPQTDTFEVRSVGAEGNVVAALAALGLRTAWLSALPDSPLGQRALYDLRALGVDTSHVRLIPNARMGLMFMEYGAGARPNVITYDREDSAFAQLHADQLDYQVASQTRWFHTTGITIALGDGPRECTRRLIANARDAGRMVSFDLNYRSRLWNQADAARACQSIAAGVDVLFGAERDMRALFGATGSPEDVARFVHDRIACVTLVMTRGEHGALALTNDGAICQVPSVPTTIVDRIGAGDAFAAGFIYSSLKELDVETSLRYGAALAALKLTIPGDVALSSAVELENIVQRPARPGDVHR
ncbi:MAG: sugar kinase [Chloroflexi bacterium]|nr:sugar kinase [Chloroflexota bacterium]